MADGAVVNSSPLIFLAKAGLIDLLRLVSPSVLVPQQVADEIRQRGPDDVTAWALAGTPWLKIVVVAAIPAVIQACFFQNGQSIACWHLLASDGRGDFAKRARALCRLGLVLPERDTPPWLICARATRA